MSKKVVVIPRRVPSPAPNESLFHGVVAVK